MKLNTNTVQIVCMNGKSLAELDMQYIDIGKYAILYACRLMPAMHADANPSGIKETA